MATLIEKIHKLEKLLNRKEEELNELETVLVKAETTIEALAKELKLYNVHGEEDEFIISKDQFIHIENQLIAYQEEIEVLKEENSVLSGRSKDEEAFTGKFVTSEVDDIAIVKIFHNMYKKITKS